MASWIWASFFWVVVFGGVPAGMLFGAVYGYFDERVRKRHELTEQRSYADQPQSDLSADDHSPDERHDWHE